MSKAKIKAVAMSAAIGLIMGFVAIAVTNKIPSVRRALS